MSVLVDSNVILDIATEDAAWWHWSANALAAASNHSRLIINPIIFAEVSAGFERIEELDIVLPVGQFTREPIPFDAAFLAGKAFVAYRRRGGLRTSPLPDFFIGAHAMVSGYQLLTRDTRQYRTYFPNLRLIAP